MSSVKTNLEDRFQHTIDVPDHITESTALARLAGHGSVRRFADRPVDLPLLRALSAIALCSPTKSDLQQRDIVLVSDPGLLSEIKALVGDQAWTSGIPVMAIFCGNNRRQRQLHSKTGLNFANNHLDAFFNASVDAAIALAAFVIAAEEAGLACCPVSAVRNYPDDMDRILGLPDHVFPIAGLAIGWPDAPSSISQRLPLDVTVHENRFNADRFEAALADYDTGRAARQPYGTQRRTSDLGSSATYCWSEDKARQYSLPERTGFGTYIRRKGFCLD